MYALLHGPSYLKASSHISESPLTHTYIKGKSVILLQILVEDVL